MKTDKMDKFAPLFVIFAAALWGVDGIVLRPSLYQLPVVVVVFVETGLATLILSPFFVRYYKIIKELKIKDWLSFLGVAVFGGAIGTMAITKALFYVNYINLYLVVLEKKHQPI